MMGADSSSRVFFAGGQIAAKQSLETLLEQLQPRVISGLGRLKGDGARPADEVDERRMVVTLSGPMSDC